MGKDYNDNNPFNNDLEDYAKGLYNLRDDVTSDLPKGNVIAKHMPLRKIIPDLLQPRHLVPAAARAGWDGTPSGIPAMLVDWHELVEGRLGKSLDARQFIQSETDELPDITVPDPDNPSKRVVDPVALGYIKTLQLAGSILKDGQRNPTSVYRSGGLFVVETGERRLMACHLLKLYMGDEHDTVLATKIDQPSIWMQVKENNVREELNAIGQARSLALLVMDMYADEVEFQAYNDLVQPGGSDRPYYAQVADGNEYRIKYGMGGEVQEAMGLPNRSMLSRYRALLEIPDDLWVKADEEGWSEFAIRSKLDELQGTNRAGAQPKNDRMLPVGNNVAGDTPPRSMSQTADHSSTHTPDTRRDIPSDDTRERPSAPAATRNGFIAGNRVYHDHYGLARIERVESQTLVAIRTEDGNRLIHHVQESDLHPAVEDAPQQQQSRDERDTTPPPAHDIPFITGQRVQLRENPERAGTVVHIKPEQRLVTARMDDTGQNFPALVGAWEDWKPTRTHHSPQPTPAAAINDLPHNLGTELADALSVIETMIDIHQRWMPDEDYSDVRDALQLLRTGTLEEIHKRTPEELDGSIDLLSAMLGHMHDAFQHRLGDAFHALNDRRDS
jgi:hypothetical protein